jgi:hypothetical protein
LFASNVERAIGHPLTITQNLQSNSFPDSYDLRIPASATFAQADDTTTNINAVANPEESEDMPMDVPTPSAGNDDQYMPISAINSFSQDWRIKARIVKMPPIRTYKNAKGDGKILNIDLIDRHSTMI